MGRNLSNKNQPFVVSYELYGYIVGLCILLIPISALLLLKQDNFYKLLGVSGILGCIFCLIDIPRQKKYLSLIYDHKERSIDNLAKALKVNYFIATFEIEFIIMNGSLKGVYIDNTARRLVVYDEEGAVDENIAVIDKVQENNTSQENSSRQEDNTRTPPRKVVVKCSDCGASNVIEVDEIGECEYCDSHITYNG